MDFTYKFDMLEFQLKDEYFIDPAGKKRSIGNVDVLIDKSGIIIRKHDKDFNSGCLFPHPNVELYGVTFINGKNKIMKMFNKKQFEKVIELVIEGLHQYNEQESVTDYTRFPEDLKNVL